MATVTACDKSAYQQDREQEINDLLVTTHDNPEGNKRKLEGDVMLTLLLGERLGELQRLYQSITGASAS